MKQAIYLDYAAATPIDKQVLAAMRPYFNEKFYNPSAAYLAAQAVDKNLQQARSRIAQVLGAKPAEIIFTAGGTEANNLALFGTAIQYEGAEIVSTAIEHESVLKPLEYLAQHGWKYKLVSPNSEGLVDPAKLAEAITDKTVLVSMMYANNEVGTIQSIRRTAQYLQEIRQLRQQKGNKLPLYFHTDAAQATNYLDLHVSRLGVDLMTLNGGKIYGPKQSGALFVAGHVKLEPIVFGGGQERGLRSGTENVAGCTGLATALEIAQAQRHAEVNRLVELQKSFYKLLEEHIPQAVINGSLKRRLPNNIHITIPGQDNERLLIQLDQAGIQVAIGSACSASNEEPSHVLKAMGISEADAQSSLRFTMGRDTTAKDINFTVSTLAHCLDI